MAQTDPVSANLLRTQGEVRQFLCRAMGVSLGHTKESMIAKSEAYIVGVGISPLPSVALSTEDSILYLVSAATKALLDAGITYDNVTRGITTENNGQGLEAFKAFDNGDGVPLIEVEPGCELTSSINKIRVRGDHCVLVVASEESTAIALVVASEKFLWRWPYLKDSAVALKAIDPAGLNSNAKPSGQLKKVCEMVHVLRGWTQDKGTSAVKGRFLYIGKSKRPYELSRADGDAIPTWEEVQHKPDGKHRLGYNPATETRQTTYEEFMAMRASAENNKELDDRICFDREGGDRAILGRQQKYLAKL